MDQISVKWNGVNKDYEVTDKSKLRQLPANIRRGILNQLNQAAKFTRAGVMDPVHKIEY